MTNVDSQTVRSLSVFSGVGGLDLALHRACPRVEPVLFCEREFAATRILRARAREGWFGPAGARAGIWSDVRTIPEWVRADLVCGGFPCVDISTAGRGEGIYAERSGLWFDMLAAAVRVRARFLVAENVAAITSRGLDSVLGSLASVGFDAEWTMLRASDVGAPHQRARWFCLAWRRVGDPLRPELQVEEAGWADGEGRTDAPGASGDVADAEGARSQGRDRVGGGAEGVSRSRQGRGASVADADSGRRCEETPPLWPPAPNDAEGWAYVLERWPYLAPALNMGDAPRGEAGAPGGGAETSRPAEGEAPFAPVRQLAHGLPSVLDVPRVDQLRALGNAVVPLQAEVAIRHLINRAPAWVQAELL